MYLKKLSILNFKNIRQAEIALTRGLNCFVGINGAGKTNILDAAYYLSMCKSALGSSDPGSLNKDVDAEFFMLTGDYLTDGGNSEEIVCSYKRGGNKSVRRAGKEYERFSDHVGLIPVVIVSPQDVFLINDAAEERRRWLNSFISQFDRDYMAALIKYNRILAERNSMLKVADVMDGGGELFDIVDEQLAHYGQRIYERRAEIIEGLATKVERYYAIISGEREEVSLSYRSALSEGSMLELLRDNRERDVLNRFTGSGIHRDDVIMKIGGQMLKRFGSQGQQKSFLVALKLAQYDDIASRMEERPLLILDDLFDKLDNHRLGHLMSLTADGTFGQTLISDCNEERLREVLDGCGVEYRLFNVADGDVILQGDEEV